MLDSASLQTTLCMGIAGRALMTATPPRPCQDPADGGRRGPDEMSEQMKDFGTTQDKQRRTFAKLGGRGSNREARDHGTNSCQIGSRQQHESDVPVPVLEPMVYWLLKLFGDTLAIG